MSPIKFFVPFAEFFLRNELVLCIQELVARIREKEISPSRLVDQLLNRIDLVNPEIDAYLIVLRTQLLQSALQLEERISRGENPRPLAGVPLIIKENIAIEGVRCSAGSKILAENIPDSDSTVVRKLKDAGAFIAGTANLHEFASGVTNVNPWYGTCRNPWDTRRISGGSSGGSAAAVASGIAFAALGSDTSGSVRIPAALCGVVGLKPTFGRVSKNGVVPLSETLDHVGILTRCASDAAIVLKTISGKDSAHTTSLDVPVEDFPEQINQPIDGLTLGVPENYFLEVLSAEVRENFEATCKRLGNLGIQVKKIHIENLESLYDTWAVIRLRGAAIFHSRWMESRTQDYGQDVMRMLKRGLEYSNTDYLKAEKDREKIRNSFSRCFGECDALISPGTPITAPFIGENEVEIEGNKFDIFSILSRLTIAANVTGFPAVVVPSGLSIEGLPYSLQIMGPPLREGTILQIAHDFETKYPHERVARDLWL